MNVEKFSGLLNLLYTDLMDVLTYEPVINADGTTGIQKTTTLKYQNIPCRISLRSPDPSANGSQLVNPIYQGLKVFCGTSLKVEKGDFLEVRRLSDNKAVISRHFGVVNQSMKYPTHQELELVQEGDA